MEIIIGLLVFAGICLLIVELIDTAGEARVGKDKYAEYLKACAEQEERKKGEKKYNGYMFTCPMCGSKKVKRIGTVNRAASIAVTGLASSKIGKQYECDNCHHKW